MPARQCLPHGVRRCGAPTRAVCRGSLLHGRHVLLDAAPVPARHLHPPHEPHRQARVQHVPSRHVLHRRRGAAQRGVCGRPLLPAQHAGLPGVPVPRWHVHAAHQPHGAGGVHGVSTRPLLRARDGGSGALQPRQLQQPDSHGAAGSRQLPIVPVVPRRLPVHHRQRGSGAVWRRVLLSSRAGVVRAVLVRPLLCAGGDVVHADGLELPVPRWVVLRHGLGDGAAHRVPRVPRWALLP